MSSITVPCAREGVVLDEAGGMACAKAGEVEVGAVAAEGAAQGVSVVRKREMMGMREAEEERGH